MRARNGLLRFFLKGRQVRLERVDEGSLIIPQAPPAPIHPLRRDAAPSKSLTMRPQIWVPDRMMQWQYRNADILIIL